MSVGIVDGLEAVQVAQRDAERLALAPRPRHLGLQDLDDRAPVPELREGVVRRLMTKRRLSGQQIAVQVENTASGAEAHLELVGVEGLGDVVVGAGLQAFDEILPVAARGQQQQVGIALAIRDPGVLADQPADLGAAQAGHHPVEDGELRRMVAAQDLPGGGAVAHRDHVVTPLTQGRFEEMSGAGAVFGDQHARTGPGGFHGVERHGRKNQGTHDIR